MGCCQSNAAGGEAANNAQPAHVAPQHAAAASVPPPRGPARATGGSRLNQRLRQPSPMPRSPKNVSNKPPPWTRSHLEQERAAFFDTRVTGSAEVWAALRRVCDLLRVGDLAGGQAILDAADVTCPNGKFSRGRGRDRNRGGVFDARGELYDIPDWVVMDPQDIVEDAEDKNEMLDADDFEDGQDVDEEAAQRRVEKGKGRAASLGEEMAVKVRSSDGTPDLEVAFGAKQNASVVVKKIKELRKSGSKVSLMYLGKPIDEKQTLEAQGWRPGNVLNAYVKGAE